MEKENNTANAKSGTPAGMKDAMKKATTEMLVLFLLRQKKMYVYEMIQEAARITEGTLTFNTLYLAIYRLKDRGYIQEDEKRIMENRTRVYFEITENGQAYLQELLREYRQITQAIDKMLEQDGKLYGGPACTNEK